MIADLAAHILVPLILGSLALYTLIGIGVGIPFIIRGITRIDPAAISAPIGFKLLILPGAIALWPIILKWWIASRRTPSGGMLAALGKHVPGAHP